MTAPRFTVLTQKELTIDLSRPAMELIIAMMDYGCDAEGVDWTDDIQCELDNFRNTLLNLLERSETRAGGEPPLRLVDNSSSPETAPGTPETGNFDLVGG